MQELIDRMIENGLSREEAITSLHTVVEWVDVTYPIAGTLVKAWIKDHSLDDVMHLSN